MDPISANLGSEFTLYSIPPPGSGALVAYILNMLMDTFPAKKDRVGGKHKGFTDPLIYHRVIEAFKFAFAKRTKLADPAFVPEVNEVYYHFVYHVRTFTYVKTFIIILF